MLGDGIFFCGGICSGVVFDWYGEIAGHNEIELCSSNVRVMLRGESCLTCALGACFGRTKVR